MTTMKFFFKTHLCLRILLTSLCVLSFIAMLLMSGLGEIVPAMVAGTSFLFLYPIERERILPSLIAVACLAVLVFCPLPVPLVSVIVLLLYFAVRIGLKYSDIRRLFSGRTVLDFFLEQARLSYLLVFFATVILSLLFSGSFFAKWCIPVLLAIEDALLLSRIWTGRSFFISDTLEKSIRKNSFTRPSPQSLPTTDSKMVNLYTALQKVMEDKKPFLDETLDLSELSRITGTNTTYLSKTINICYGQNFNRFVNSYRVRYALNLMTSDPRLKMKEVFVMAGFHSQVSFDMAFKAEVGLSPKEYMRESAAIRSH